jgi:predicted branched-subunit amino acid permease
MSLAQKFRDLLAHPEFRRGVLDVAPVMPGMLAWGTVSGVAMVKGGLSVPLALTMSLLVYSAGAQLGALTLMASGAPLWVIIAATVCVNLRFVIFSAGLRPFLIGLPFLRRVTLGYLCADLSYILFTKRFAGATQPGPGQIEYLLGTTSLNWIGWQLATVVGVAFANIIPTEWGLGYAGVLALLGLSCSLLVDRKSAIAAAIAFIAALVTQGLPLRLNIVVAIAVAVAVGMLLDRVAPTPREATA